MMIVLTLMIEDESGWIKIKKINEENWTMVNQWRIKINEDELRHDFAHMNEDAWRWRCHDDVDLFHSLQLCWWLWLCSYAAAADNDDAVEGGGGDYDDDDDDYGRNSKDDVDDSGKDNDDDNKDKKITMIADTDYWSCDEAR